MGVLIRLIIIGVVLWFAYQAIQRLLGSMRAKQDLPNHNPAHSNPNQQLMRPCAQCGVHIPEGESSQSRGHFFCCEAHRDAYFRNHRS